MMHVYAFLQPGWADWEAGFVLSGFRRHFGGTTWVASPDGEPVESIGGITAAANFRFDEVAPAQGAVLLLIGSDAWCSFADEGTLSIIKRTFDQGCIVGAICGGTIAAARAGLLSGRLHTSNSQEYLREQAPAYSGAEFYRHSPRAVCDGHLVTAPGHAPLSFAAAVFRAALPTDPDRADRYYNAHSEEFGGVGF